MAIVNNIVLKVSGIRKKYIIDLPPMSPEMKDKLIAALAKFAAEYTKEMISK